MSCLNLSTRPFYNERAVHIVLALLAVALVAISVFNARELFQLSQRQTELQTAIATADAQARELRQRATRLRSQLDQADLEAVLQASREANALIDRRTFSWTGLLNDLEATLPGDVRLTAVQPKEDKGVFVIALGVIARRPEDINEFIERLEKTRSFSNLLTSEESPSEEGGVRATVVGQYAPAGRAPGEAPATGAAPAAPAAGGGAPAAVASAPAPGGRS